MAAILFIGPNPGNNPDWHPDRSTQDKNAINLLPIQGDWRGAFKLLLIPYLGLEIASSYKGDLNNRSVNAPKSSWFPALLAGFIPCPGFYNRPGSFISWVFHLPLLNPLIDLTRIMGWKMGPGQYGCSKPGGHAPCFRSNSLIRTGNVMP